MNKTEELYFDWMESLVCKGCAYRRETYSKLLKYLDSVEFKYFIPGDANRLADGVGLRRRFEWLFQSVAIADDIRKGNCSVFEMMVALSLRMEEDFMADPTFGDRTWYWFWSMIQNMQLDFATDDIFDNEFEKVELVVNKFINRSYLPDGIGNLFHIPFCPFDLRSMEIWNQMCHYLSSYKM